MPWSLIVLPSVARGYGSASLPADIKAPCEQLIDHFRQCHAAFLEANYDEELLDKGRYPIYLKNRIRGGKGHLSNSQALELYKAHRPSFMSHLLLSHLSRDNNRPQLVQELFDRHAGGIRIIVASRDEATEVYHISAECPASISAEDLASKAVVYEEKEAPEEKEGCN